jgi:hypothetical protein
LLVAAAFAQSNNYAREPVDIVYFPGFSKMVCAAKTQSNQLFLVATSSSAYNMLNPGVDHDQRPE